MLNGLILIFFFFLLESRNRNIHIGCQIIILMLESPQIYNQKTYKIRPNSNNYKLKILNFINQCKCKKYSSYHYKKKKNYLNSAHSTNKV